MSGSNKSSLLSAPKSSGSKTGPESCLGSDGGLRLRAEDADDLCVISACLQDAIVPVADITYLGQDRQFALVANRFRREPGRGAGHARERILSGLAFEDVERVQRRGLAASAVNGFLSLLSVELIETSGDGATVELRFSGGAAVRLTAGRLQARLQDMGEGWPTQWAPTHDE